MAQAGESQQDEGQDAGSTRADDSGVVAVDSGVPDAGPIRLDCFAPPDAGLYLSASLVPVGCTHLNGNLLVVGVFGENIADSTTSSISSLKEVEGVIAIECLFMTGNLRGFGNLERVTGSLVIKNTELPSVSAVNRLKEVGSLALLTAYGLQDVEFGGLEVIHGDLFIYDNAELQSLAGLRNLRTIEGKLIVGRNPKLRSAALAAFTSRVVIDGGVERR